MENVQRLVDRWDQVLWALVLLDASLSPLAARFEVVLLSMSDKVCRISFSPIRTWIAIFCRRAESSKGVVASNWLNCASSSLSWARVVVYWACFD